jgi:hypothetical protein
MATKLELLDELRFAKRQQWAITAAAIALIAGIYHIADNADPPMRHWEQHLAAFLVLGVAGGGIGMLFKLQGHLCRTRLAMDKKDPNPWRRGLDVVIALAIAIAVSAIAVCYSFWRA